VNPYRAPSPPGPTHEGLEDDATHSGRMTDCKACIGHRADEMIEELFARDARRSRWWGTVHRGAVRLFAAVVDFLLIDE